MVDQGPDFSGPGIMEPYRTYAPPPAYSPYGYGVQLAYYHHTAPHYYGNPYRRRVPTGS